MKRTILLILVLCLSFGVSGASFSETAVTEKTAAEMSGEELYLAGREALDAQDYGKAKDYFQMAADAGNIDGWRGLGTLYINGEGVEMSTEKAMEYYQMAAERGDAKSMYNIALTYLDGQGVEKDTGRMIEYFEKSGDHGFAEAWTILGNIFQYGQEVEHDIGRAAEYYRKAAELDDSSACYTLAVMYFGGEGVEQDYGRAAEYYQKAADLGMVQALSDLGMMYSIGTGMEKDDERALDYFTQAAELGEPTAMFRLGEALRLGQGLEKDEERATEWYRKAMEAGYDPDDEEREILKTALGDDYALYFPVQAEGQDYAVWTAPVLTGKEQVDSMVLRFYPLSPHVPYYGLKDYVNRMYQTGLTVTPRDDGVWEVANPNGTKILVNPSAGTIEAEDWARFQMPPLPYTTMAGVKDSDCGWTYYSEVVFDGPPDAVTFDFARYGIAVYADGEDVYLPLALLSTMFTDVACNHVLWNGESVLLPAMEASSIMDVPVEWYESGHMRSLLTGGRKREADVIFEDYAELCFCLDYFYGHPGPGILDRGIREKGLDAALDDVPELASFKDRLKDPDMLEYMLAVFDLFNLGLDEGHSGYNGFNGIGMPDFPYPMFANVASARAGSMYQARSFALDQIRGEVMKARNAAWGDEVYRECGSTAIIRINGFTDDVAGWEAYYAGEGEIPMDAVGITWTGLKRASENPAIRNVLFDLSANTGGSNDMLMYMLDLMFGEDVFHGNNVLTGQGIRAVVHSDKNLDGVFDEKDDEVKYDFNYAVLTTRASFSCGNLLPILMQEHGAVLLGEPTGGGSCVIQISTLTGGGAFIMSSWLWALSDAEGRSVEGGCRTDLPIARIEPELPPDADPTFSVGDYTPYFDDVMLDRMICEWFEEQALAPAA